MGKSRKPAAAVATYWATQMAGVSFEIAFFIVLGYWGDRRWGTAPWLLLLGSAVGMFVGAWHLWQLVRAVERANQKEKEEG